MNEVYSDIKNNENILKHGISFSEISEFQWGGAVTVEDIREDYGERRFLSYGMIQKRLYVLVWTPRHNVVRPISLRKANKRERRYYETY